MNIQEVHATGHGIWIFAALSIAMLTVSCLSWLFCCTVCKARRNWEELSQIKTDRLLPVSSRFKSVQNFQALDKAIARQQGHVQRGLKAHWCLCRVKRWACYLGLASLETLNISPQYLAGENDRDPPDKYICRRGRRYHFYETRFLARQRTVPMKSADLGSERAGIFEPEPRVGQAREISEIDLDRRYR